MAKKVRASQRRNKKDEADLTATADLDVLSEEHTIADSFAESLSVFGNHGEEDDYGTGALRLLLCTKMWFARTSSRTIRMRLYRLPFCFGLILRRHNIFSFLLARSLARSLGRLLSSGLSLTLACRRGWFGHGRTDSTG